MPQSKRNKQVELSKTKKHGLEGKKELQKKIRECVDSFNNIFVFTVNDMRNAKMKSVRNDWKDSRFFIGKNKVMARAFGLSEAAAYRNNLHKIGEQIKGQCGLFFTNRTVDEVLKWFRSYSVADFARSGTPATEDVFLKEGPLPDFPHNLEPYLRQLGLPTTLQKGVIHMVRDHLVCSAGDILSPETAKVLQLLGYEMAEFQINMQYMWSQDGTFRDLKSGADVSDDERGAHSQQPPSMVLDASEDEADMEVDEGVQLNGGRNSISEEEVVASPKSVSPLKKTKSTKKGNKVAEKILQCEDEVGIVDEVVMNDVATVSSGRTPEVVKSQARLSGGETEKKIELSFTPDKSAKKSVKIEVKSEIAESVEDAIATHGATAVTGEIAGAKPSTPQKSPKKNVKVAIKAEISESGKDAKTADENAIEVDISNEEASTPQKSPKKNVEIAAKENTIVDISDVKPSTPQKSPKKNVEIAPKKQQSESVKDAPVANVNTIEEVDISDDEPSSTAQKSAKKSEGITVRAETSKRVEDVIVQGIKRARVEVEVSKRDQDAFAAAGNATVGMEIAETEPDVPAKRPKRGQKKVEDSKSEDNAAAISKKKDAIVVSENEAGAKASKKTNPKATQRNRATLEKKNSEGISDVTSLAELTEQKLKETPKPKKFSPKMTRSRAAATKTKIKTPEPIENVMRSARKTPRVKKV